MIVSTNTTLGDNKCFISIEGNSKITKVIRVLESEEGGAMEVISIPTLLLTKYLKKLNNESYSDTRSTSRQEI
jgi:hypothetical protein